MSNNYSAMLLADFYKICHKDLYPTGTELIYSTFTPRSSVHGGNLKVVVAFGLQGFIKKYLIEYFNENFFNREKNEVVSEYERVVKHTLAIENPDTSHIEALHDLGYLPVKIKSVKEGTLLPIKVPMLTIENTLPEFFWITNYLETLLSTELWQATTSATKAKNFRDMLDGYAMETVGNTDGVGYQGHDFSMRGMSSLESAQLSGAGHLLSFVGTDTIPAILYHEKYYNADVEKELVGCSVKATEHSIQSSYGRDELNAFTQIIDKTPTGILSIVTDTYDFWDNIENMLPQLKDKIMARDGKIVIRPDSGIPENILCGKHIEDLTNDKYVHNLEDAKQTMKEILSDKVGEETPHGEYGESDPVGEFKYEGKYYRIKLDIFWNRYDKQYYYMDGVSITSFEEFTPSVADLGLIEALWNLFGGTVNAKGYKELDSHIGAIYGDSINYDRGEEICKRLKEKGFASTNVVMGLGSYFYQYNTRDTFGFAMKATYAVINGEERMLFKDPKTDDGTKRSQRGMVAVLMDEENGEIYHIDGLDSLAYSYIQRADKDLLEPMFIDGVLLRDESLSDIRKLLASQ